MKTIKTARLVQSLFLLFALGVSARADTLINNFDNPFDYVASGIIGDTNWDGVYLRFGDVPGGSAAGYGNGNTTVASTMSPYAGFLSLQNVGGDWGGAGDDGFFLYKVVQGDFDVSVQNVPGTLTGGAGFDNRGYNFTGLMLRACHTNNSGAPFSTTLTNNAENMLLLWRFNEFSIDGQVRISTNGANIELNFPGSDSETNSSRFFRIVRQDETNFTFYVKTNAGDAWFQVRTLTRADWAGVALQAGIAQAAFATASRDAIFDNFQLAGPNVTFPVMPAAPSGLVTTATNTAGALTFSWTLGTPGDSSLVVISPRPIQHNPVQGRTYNSSATFGDPSALLGGDGEFVVYNGTGTSVTVTNLGANNLNYYVAVYEYTVASPPVYNTASPATGVFAGPGVITGASLVAPANDIPMGGAVALQLMATFSTGETSDQSASATWASSDNTIANVNTSGVVSGVTNGTATITATFGSYTPSTNITVHAPAFTDNFGTTQNYLTNGLQGSAWDGLYLNFGDVPGANKGSEGVAGQTFQLIADTNILYLQAAGGSWRVAGNDGPYLFKIVTGDFQASVHVTCGTINLNYAGIMARLFNNSKTSSQGGGGGAGGAETHINWGNPQQGTASARRTIDSGGTTTVAGLSTDRWLLMVRQNSTNFLFFEKANPADPWNAVPAATMVLDQASNNAPMQVGLFQEMRQATTDFARYDTFMLDGPGIVSPSGTQPPPPAANLTATLNPDLSITYTWVAASNGVPVQNILVMRDGGPVTAQPTYGFGFTVGAGTYPFGTATSLGDGNYLVFRSANPPASTNNTATITGLIPGHTYYAAVYTFAGAYPDRVFNNVLPSTGATVRIVDGVLEGIITPPIQSIPAGGAELAKVIGVFSGGALLDISSAATAVSTNTSVVATMNNILSGIGNGTTTVAIFISGSPYTNYVPVTVRAPAFTDNFSVNHDYLNNGVTGTAWDGVYRQGSGTNGIPGSEYAPDPTWGTAVADANISSNNILTVSAVGDGWEDNTAGGFFLFKYVPGDFQVAVHINTNDYLTLLGAPAGASDYHQPGLLARAYSSGTNGTTLGAPFVIGPLRTNTGSVGQPVIINTYGESWVSLTRFDEFDIGTYARLTLDSATQQTTQPDQGDLNYWLLILRRDGTNFSFYKRLAATDPWRPVPNKTTYRQAEFAGAPMQVGLMAGPWWWTAGENRTVHFENFMLDRTTGSPLSISVSGGYVTLRWPPMPNATVWSTGTLTPPSWQQVPGTPTLGPNGYSLTFPAGAGPEFFRLQE